MDISNTPTLFGGETIVADAPVAPRGPSSRPAPSRVVLRALRAVRVRVGLALADLRRGRFLLRATELLRRWGAEEWEKFSARKI